MNYEILHDNYDLSTPEGMANAVEWTQALVSHINEGGTWVVPRSGTIYRIHHAKKLAEHCGELVPDPSIIQVFKAMGWTVQSNCA